jgi:2,3-diketo-5-methylthio-1-phosphopentane phosphatase
MWHVVTDFDGTVTREDVAEILLREFTGDGWLAVENEFRAERIGVREAMEREFALLGQDREALLEVVDRRAELDPEFPEFVREAAAAGVGVEIASEGLEFYVAHLLGKWRLPLPFRANREVWAAGRMRLDHPFADATCRLCGTCKMGRVLQLRAAGKRVAFVGDGHSDLCPAVEADRVYAKGHLAALCRREGIEFIPFEDFGDVRRSPPWR